MSGSKAEPGDPSKTLSETAYNAFKRLAGLRTHEKAAALQMMAALLQAEAKNIELAPPADEHYRQ